MPRGIPNKKVEKKMEKKATTPKKASGRKVLSPAQVKEIRKNFEKSRNRVSAAELAKKFGVSTVSIYNVKNEKTHAPA